MATYSERLWPTFWSCVSFLPLVPALILVAAPFNIWIGVIAGIVIYGAFLVFVIFRSALVTVDAEKFVYGSAMVETEFIGAVSAFSGDAARVERGTGLDSRAYTKFRAFMPGVVKLEITDESDPTPYWLVSTRHPQKLAEALRQARS